MTMSLDDFINEMESDSAKWFGYENVEHELQTFVLGLVGESGEVADELKKYIRGTRTWKEMQEKIEVELIDVFHYWCLLIGLFGIDVEEVYKRKREFNAKRYG